MRDKQRHISSTAPRKSRMKTIAFEAQQLAHEAADEKQERREWQHEQHYLDRMIGQTMMQAAE